MLFHFTADFFEHKLQPLLEGTPTNFDDWTSLIREVEKTSPVCGNFFGYIRMYKILKR